VYRSLYFIIIPCLVFANKLVH